MFNPFSVFGKLKDAIRDRAIVLAITKALERKEMEFLRGIVGSKKLGALISGVLVLVFREVLGLDEATAQKIVEIVMAYLVGQSTVDALIAFRGGKQ